MIDSDPYSRTDYRRLIAWEARIQRERPFLRSLLETAPDPSVLDLGCGTGEHTAFFAELGARAVGLDRSESMLERAREHEAGGKGRFVEGDVLTARQHLENQPLFGLTVCLGNMLPHILEECDLDSLLDEVKALLLPGGKLLLQILNYRRIIEDGIRHLPVNFREGEDPDEEIVFLRLMKPMSAERILFMPTTLTLNVNVDEPVAVKTTRRVELRPWTAEDLSQRLEYRGFQVKLHGDMEGGDYVPEKSSDLVIVATRNSAANVTGGTH